MKPHRIYFLNQDSPVQEKLHSNLITLWAAFFQPLVEKQYSWFRLGFLGTLYLLGIYLWGKTFGWGRISLDYFDWALINIPRIDFVRHEPARNRIEEK